MRSNPATHEAELARAREGRKPYHEAVRLSRRSGLKLVWLYAIGWPAVLSFLYGSAALLQGDVKDGAPALGLAAAWALLVSAVVYVVTRPMRQRARLLETFAARVGGVAFRSPRPDRVLAWLDRFWVGEAPRSLLLDGTGAAYFAGLEATYGGCPLLIVAVRATFWPRVRAVLLLSAPGPRDALAAPECRVRLAELGYAVTSSPTGVLLTSERAASQAFAAEQLDSVVRAAWELAKSTGNTKAGYSDDGARRRLRALAIERWQHVLHFDQRDLAQNARGLLSVRQRFSCALRGLSWVLCSLLSAAGAIHVAFGGGSHRPDRGSSFELVLGVLVLALLALVLGFVALRALWDSIDGHAGLLIGPLRHSATTGSKGGTQHWLSCGAGRFSVPAAAEYAIEGGLLYRVYFAPHSDRLLSLEPLETPS